MKAIAHSIHEHGTLIYEEREFHLKERRRNTDACFFADIFAVYRDGARFFLVGIEVKDWNAKVGHVMARRYMETYGQVCEYFYLAARRFSKALYAAPSIGLFSLERMEVVKSGRYLSPDEGLRSAAISRMKQGGLLRRVVDSACQTNLDEFSREGGTPKGF